MSRLPGRGIKGALRGFGEEGHTVKGKEAGSLAPHLSSKCCSLEKLGDEAGKRSRTVGTHQTAVEVSPGRHCDGSGWGGLEDFYGRPCLS